MTTTPVMCSSAAALVKAGANVSNYYSAAFVCDAINEAEAYVCDLVKYDAVTNWASLSAIKKLIFTEYCARSAAVEAIQYDMSGYTSRVEAEDMINVHLFRINQIENLLNKASVQDFVGV